MNKLIIFFTNILCFASLVSPQSNNYEVYYQWKQIDYTYSSEAERYEAILNGSYISVNCATTGVKIYRDMIFLATPRYRSGVPSTLNVIPYKKSQSDEISRRNEGPKLSPYPSWEMNEIGNCTALQTVQAMELDPYNRLWIVDVGRVDILTPLPRNLCPAKLVIYDINADEIDRIYEFPADVVSRETNVIKDIQVACTSRDDCHSFISNLKPPCQIIVYDYKNNDSWYATHSSMQPDLSRSLITIDGVSTVVPFGQTGLGITPKYTNYSTVYYSKIAGDHIYSVPTSVLMDSARLKVEPALEDTEVTDLGMKPMGQADGTAMDNRGRWYFGSLPESAVYSIDTNGDPSTLPQTTKAVQSHEEMQWPDTFTFDGAGNLLLTTTRFQRYPELLINPTEINYRLIRFRTGSLSYSS